MNLLIIPAIVLAEAVWIVDRGRTSIPSAIDLLNAVNADPRTLIYPVDETVIEQSLNLFVITKMHDRLIVATAIVLEKQGEKVSLLTCDREAALRDRNITASGLLTIVW